MATTHTYQTLPPLRDRKGTGEQWERWLKEDAETRRINREMVAADLWWQMWEDAIAEVERMYPSSALADNRYAI